MLRAKICRKDTSGLIKETILDTLTAGLKIVATWYLNIERNGEGQILCEFKEIQCAKDSREATIDCRKATIYVTGHRRLGLPSNGTRKRIHGWMVVHAV
jgi:hypothetical protein